MQDLIELRECLHDTGVTSAVHYQYVLRVLLSRNTRLDVFFWLSWLVTTVEPTSDLHLSLMTTISVHVPADTLNKFSE